MKPTFLSCAGAAGLLLFPFFLRAQVCFKPVPFFGYSHGANHTDLHIANMDGDTDLDIVTNNRDGNQVQIIKRNGTGPNDKPLFEALPTTIGTGNNPVRLFIRDFDHDGDNDIATANRFGNSMTVLLNDGSGGMSDTNYTVGLKPVDVTGGYFNPDAVLDLAVANFDDQTVSIFYGDGNGGFTAAPMALSTGAYNPMAVTAGDFDHDGKDDLLMLLAGNSWYCYYRFYKGNGQGGFTAQTIGQTNVSVFGTNDKTAGTDTADFNNDGLLDVVLNFKGAKRVFVLKGNANGFPGSLVTVPLNTGLPNTDVCAADFNGDGNCDLAVSCTNGNWADTVKILLGNGSMSFAPTMNYGMYNSTSTSIAATDFNNDGKPDLAVGNYCMPNGSTRFDIYTAINTTPYFDISGPVHVCGVQPVTLTASDTNLVYIWDAGAVSDTGVSVTFNPMPGNNPFSVVANDGFGCTNLSYGTVEVVVVNAQVALQGITLTSQANPAQYQWLNCSDTTAIFGATLQSFTPTQSGDYAVRIETDGCADTSSCYTVIIETASLTPDETNDAKNFNIYPNPGSGTFYLEATTTGRVTVTDALGRVVAEFALTSTTAPTPLNLTGPAGIYVVTLSTAKRHYMRKLVLK